MAAQARLDDWLLEKKEDSTWVLTSAFMILTMQSGFGALESGFVSPKFEVNVMMKNVIDVVFGGMSYWIMGYGISFGESWKGIVGTTKFLVNVSPRTDHLAAQEEDELYSKYLFQFTFASTATTIVSGSVAGRMKFNTYIFFSFLNVVVYAFTCHWVWHEDGWLKHLGFQDFAGDGPVHLMGGANGLTAAWMIGPRRRRFEPGMEHRFGMKNPMNCILGLFMLWWGWLGFNCGSTFGISGRKWLVASRVAVTTINSSIGAGCFGVCISGLWLTPGIVEVEEVVNAILAGLVAITAGCANISPAEAVFVGILGAGFACMTNRGLIKYKLVDDPVGATGVHGVAAFWGLLSLGVFGRSFEGRELENSGLLHGGGFELFWIQMVGAVCILAWTSIMSVCTFKLLDITVGLRAHQKDEETGFDTSEHNVQYDLSLTNAEAGAPELLQQFTAMSEKMSQMASSMEAMQEELTLLRGLKETSHVSTTVSSQEGWCQGIVLRQPSDEEWTPRGRV